MIDLENAYEIRNVLNDKIIDKIEDELGNIWYEAFKVLLASGVPPITLQKCKGKPRILPSEYQQVDYIEGTGTQVINSNVVTSDDIGMYVDYFLTEVSTIMGSRGDMSSDTRFWINPSSSSSIYYGWNLPYILEFSNAIGVRSTIELNLYNSRKITAYNNTIDTPVTQRLEGTLSTDNTANIGIFGYGRNDGSLVGKIARIYRAKITKGSILIRDFVPCYRKSDNVIGLYDLVENKFYENAGTGTFLKGSDTPNSVDLVDYKIYGNSEQKIDTSNIWDGTYPIIGSYYDANGNITEYETIAMTDMMELKYSIYDITCVSYSDAFYGHYFRYNFFDENKQWLSQIAIHKTGNAGETTTEYREIEVPTGAKYINFSVISSQMDKGQKYVPVPKTHLHQSFLLKLKA